MSLSARILEKETRSRERAQRANVQTYYNDTKYAYEELYADLPMWERTARSAAYGFEKLPVDICEDDAIVGRYFFKIYDPDSDPNAKPRPVKTDEPYHYELAHNEMLKEVMKLCPEVRTDFLECGIHGDAFWTGHEAHSFQTVLHLGWGGMKELAGRMLAHTSDEKSREYYRGLIITLDAIMDWNDRNADELEKMGKLELAKMVRKVPRKPVETFHEAVQVVNMVYFTVTREASGTYGPGWVDYYLWPYLEKDLQENRITMQEARDLIGELLINIDCKLCCDERHNDTICLGGSHPNGTSAVNPLTYIIAEATLELSITCLLVYLKMPENPPKEYVEFAAKYIIEGRNRGQILNDRAIAGSLEYRGTPYHEALSYTSNGCMEISCSNANSDLLLCGWHSMPKFVEFAITGGKCLVSGKQYDSVHFRKLSAYPGFEDFYKDFLAENKRILHMYFNCVDLLSEKSEIYRPTYYASSLLSDCMLRGRNMHGGGTRYHDYGTSPVGLANAADALFAIKKAVFDDKICTADELVGALECNFQGSEVLRLKLRSIPKYGQDNDEADEFAVRYFNDICDIYESYENRHGGCVKPVVFTFIWATEVGRKLGATADGNFAGTAAAHGTTPASMSMTEGVTAAILSNCKIPFHRLSGGGSSMWDFDPSWINEKLLGQLMQTFLDLGGQMFQGNSSVVVEDLVKARSDPKAYQHIIVRVGGFSARFVDLTSDVQEDIIKRHRHNS